MPDAGKISVVVTCYDDPHRLALCLDGLSKQTHPFDLVVVNDGGEEDLRRIVDDSGIPHAQYLYMPPKTTEFRLAAARNLGIRHTRGTRILTLDGDCVPAPDVVARHATYDDNRVVYGRRLHVGLDHVGALVPGQDLSPFVVSDDARFRHKSGPYAVMYRQLQAGKRQFKLPHWRNAWGFQVSYPAQSLLALGGFWEEFRSYGGEDQDLAWRLKSYGCELWVDFDAICWHLDHPQRTLGTTAHLYTISRSRGVPGLVRNGKSLVRIKGANNATTCTDTRFGRMEGVSGAGASEV